MEGTTVKAFRKGLKELKYKDYLPVKREIFRILGVSARQTFNAYADGKRELDIDKYNRIADLFRANGVSDCWGK